jgi:hypothetical protein
MNVIGAILRLQFFVSRCVPKTYLEVPQMGEVQTKLLRNRWRVVGAGVTVVLLGIILLWVTIQRPDVVEQKPRGKWMATKDNFVKLRVGMTLLELEDIFGVGEPARRLEDSKGGEGWETAIKEYRVYRWGLRGPEYPPVPTCPVIMAAFPVPPSADPAAKVLALSFRDGGTWDEDKGTLAGAHTGKGR